MSAPKFFKRQIDFRSWLQKNHDRKTELLVGFYKVGSRKPSMTWSESVDQALCFGWIDGVRRRLDDDSYTIRFTPRRSNSVWSAINIKKVEELTSQGLMHPAGLRAFEKRCDKRSRIYAYEKKPEALAPDLERKFKENTDAWKFFQKQPPGYKRLCVHYVMSAKQENTRMSRLLKLILASKAEERL